MSLKMTYIKHDFDMKKARINNKNINLRLTQATLGQWHNR